MKTIDRFMKAYLSTRKLSDEQKDFVRADLSKFINDLRSGKTNPETTTKDSYDPDSLASVPFESRRSSSCK